MRRNSFAIVLLSAVFFVGCNMSMLNLTVKKPITPKDDQQAKLFSPNPDRATVYVFRDNSFLGGKLKSQLIINHVIITENGKNQFSVVSMMPGEYDLSSHSGNEANAATSLTHNRTKPAVHLNAEANHVYYYKEAFSTLNGFSLEPMSAENAQPIIRKAKLSQSRDL